MQPTKPTPFQTTLAFDEADGEGIVFFGNYFRLAHRALEFHLPQIGIPWVTWFRHPEYGVPLRHVEADYMAPLRPGDTLNIEVGVTKLGDSSVEFIHRFTHADGKPAATVRTVHVFVSRKTFYKVQIPEDIRGRLSS